MQIRQCQKTCTQLDPAHMSCILQLPILSFQTMVPAAEQGNMAARQTEWRIAGKRGKHKHKGRPANDRQSKPVCLEQPATGLASLPSTIISLIYQHLQTTPASAVKLSQTCCTCAAEFAVHRSSFIKQHCRQLCPMYSVSRMTSYTVHCPRITVSWAQASAMRQIYFLSREPGAGSPFSDTNSKRHNAEPLLYSKRILSLLPLLPLRRCMARLPCQVHSGAPRMHALHTPYWQKFRNWTNPPPAILPIDHPLVQYLSPMSNRTLNMIVYFMQHFSLKQLNMLRPLCTPGVGPRTPAGPTWSTDLTLLVIWTVIAHVECVHRNN